MSRSELVVPVLLCFTACYALGKRVDVYTALTRGAEEGLNVLVHILPSLIALLTAVYMFRASGAMEYLGALLAPALERVGITPEVAPLLFIRPISGSGAMNDYEYGDYPWMDYRNSIQTIVIGDQITQIGWNAFPWTACSTI